MRETKALFGWYLRRFAWTAAAQLVIFTRILMNEPFWERWYLETNTIKAVYATELGYKLYASLVSGYGSLLFLGAAVGILIHLDSFRTRRAEMLQSLPARRESHFGARLLASLVLLGIPALLLFLVSLAMLRDVTYPRLMLAVVLGAELEGLAGGFVASQLAGPSGVPVPCGLRAVPWMG